MGFVLTSELISLSVRRLQITRVPYPSSPSTRRYSNCIELRERVIYHHLRSIDFDLQYLRDLGFSKWWFRTFKSSVTSRLVCLRLFTARYGEISQKTWTILGALSQNCEIRLLVSSHLFVCPSVRIRQLCSRWTDFNEIWYLNIIENLSRNSSFFTIRKNNGYFSEVLCTYMISLWILFRITDVSDKRPRENDKTHFMFNKLFDVISLWFRCNMGWIAGKRWRHSVRSAARALPREICRDVTARDVLRTNARHLSL
jgi:hypothetical protein